MSSAKFEAVSAKLNAELVELQAQLEQAQAREVLVIGNTYSIQVGKADTARVVEAVLVGQRTRENGVQEFRFSFGEGWDARYYDISYNKVVLETVEGELSSAAIAKLIARVQGRLDGLAEKLAAQEALENLTDGGTYNIKVGKGDAQQIIPAVLLGQRYNEDKGNKEYAFFYGAGFDAKVVTVTIGRVVFEGNNLDEDDDGNVITGEGAAALVEQPYQEQTEYVAQ